MMKNITILLLFLASLRTASAQPCQITLPADTVICSNPISYAIHPTGTGFIHYQWNTGDTTQQITATQSGLYIVNATSASGCIAKDSIYIQTSFVSGATLGQDRSLCGTSGTGVAFSLDPYIYIDPYTDSLIIIYDAQNGVSGLVGATSVYMHSGAEFVANGGWQTVVGNWGQNDGLGKMTSMGNNKWKISIYPQSYYHYAPGGTLHGIYMVFRNADGTATGKDNQNNDFYLDMHTNPIIPLSSYQLAMFAQHTSSMPTYLWNTGDVAPAIAPDTTGTYSVIVTDLNGCMAKDTVHAQYYPYPNIDLGANTVICNNSTMTLNPGGGYAHYSWNTGDSTATITISEAGYYEVYVKNQIGCEVYDPIFVASSALVQNELLMDTAICNGQIIVLDAATFMQNKGDSIRIVYDATKGQTGLVGANAVYMHAGAEITQFGGWQYIKGNWGFDDGIGKMDSLGNNKWAITIHPQSYFGYAPATNLEGIWMIFRNENGSLTGKDANGDDIYVFINNGNTPTCTFNGVNANFFNPLNANISYDWGIGQAGSSISTGAAGIYTVTIQDGFCAFVDTFLVQQKPSPIAQFSSVNPTLCNFTFTNQSLHASSYTWNFGDGSPAIFTQNSTHSFPNGQYLVTLTATNECGMDTFSAYVNCLGVAIDKNDNLISDLSIYPNPAHNQVNISFNAIEKDNFSIKIYNSMGSLITERTLQKAQQNYQASFSTEMWAKGNYFLFIQGEQGFIGKLFIIE